MPIPLLSPRQNVVLAALAACTGSEFAPVQVQKLFFLIDENVADCMGGKQFHFEPYDYGPFDSAVYSELERLAQLGLVHILNPSAGGRRRYTLTPKGQELGQSVLGTLHPRVRNYFPKISAWILGLSFAQLVGAIYKMYPNMREKSVFRD